MPGPKAVAVILTPEEKAGLQRLIQRHKVSQQVAKRAQIVLAASEGKSNRQIVREMKVSVDMVRQWRQRWVDLQPIALADLEIEERLQDLLRPGAPAHYPRPGMPDPADGLREARRIRTADHPLDQS